MSYLVRTYDYLCCFYDVSVMRTCIFGAVIVIADAGCRHPIRIRGTATMMITP